MALLEDTDSGMESTVQSCKDLTPEKYAALEDFDDEVSQNLLNIRLIPYYFIYFMS